MRGSLSGASLPSSAPHSPVLLRHLIVLSASKVCFPEVEGRRVVPVTSMQDILVGLDGVPDDTPWTEWGRAPLGRAMLRRHLQARGGPWVRLVPRQYDPWLHAVEDEDVCKNAILPLRCLQ